MPKDYSEIAEFFRISAREGYSLDDQNKYVPQALLDENFDAPTAMTSLTHVFKSNKKDRLTLVAQQKILEPAGDQLLTKGLKEFSYVARGSSAVCLTSEGKAIRVGISPVKISNRTDLSDVRDPCSLILQPEHSVDVAFANARMGVIFEALPYIHMINDNDIPEDFQKLVHALLSGTSYVANNEFKDLGVLPDGTPIYVDPGAINLKRKGLTASKEDAAVIEANADKLGWPKDLTWLLPNGRFKQEAFFPKPADPLSLVMRL